MESGDRQSVRRPAWLSVSTIPGDGRTDAGGAGAVQRPEVRSYDSDEVGRWADHQREQAAIWTAYGRLYVPGGAPAVANDGVLQQVDTGVSRRVLPSGDIEAMICARSWPCSEALAVVYGPTPACPTGESNGDPNAVNGQHAGLFQIAMNWHAAKFAGRDPYDPQANIAVAYMIWQDSGGNWSAWSCRP